MRSYARRRRPIRRRPRIVRRRRVRRLRAPRRIPRSLPMNGMPTKYLARHRWVETFTLQPRLVPPEELASVALSANGMYNPANLIVPPAAGFHSAMGFDQMGVFYNHYCIVGSKITARFYNEGSTNRPPAWCGILLADAPEDLSTRTLQYVCEQRWTATPRMNGVVTIDVGPKVIQKKFSAKKYFGTPFISSPDTYQGSTGTVVGSNPSEQAYFIPWVGVPTGSVSSEVNVMVTIEYIALWTGPKLPLQS